VSAAIIFGTDSSVTRIVNVASIAGKEGHPARTSRKDH